MFLQKHYVLVALDNPQNTLSTICNGTTFHQNRVIAKQAVESNQQRDWFLLLLNSLNVISLCCMKHKLISRQLHCIGVKAGNLKETGRIQLKLSDWLDTTRCK